MTARLLLAFAAVTLTTATASAQVRPPVIVPQTTVRPAQFIPPGNPLLPFQGPLVPGTAGRVIDPFSGVVTDFRTASNPWTGVTKTETASVDPFTGRTINRTAVTNPNVGKLSDTFRTDPYTGTISKTTKFQPTPLFNPILPYNPLIGR